jgi:hypothetical protein
MSRLFVAAQRLVGLAQFDEVTDDRLSLGCHTAEQEAAKRYGTDWRDTRRTERAGERSRRFGILDRIFSRPTEIRGFSLHKEQTDE